MRIIPPPFLPTALVAGVLAVLGFLSASTSTALADVDRIVPSDTVIGTGQTAVYAVVDSPSPDYSVDLSSATGSAQIIFKLNGSSSGDLDLVGPTQEVNGLAPVSLCAADESLVLQLESLGVDFADFDQCTEWVVLVVLFCEDLGTFDVSFSNQDSNSDSLSTELECRGDPDNNSVTATPSVVEIIPQEGSTATSTIVVGIFDAAGNPAVPGDDVLYLTDNCLLDDAPRGPK